MEIVWEVLFLLQANFIVCISGMRQAQKGQGSGGEIPYRVPKCPLIKGQEEQLNAGQNCS